MDMLKLIKDLCVKLGVIARVSKSGNGICIYGLEAIVEQDLSEDVKAFMADVKELGKNASFFPPSADRIAMCVKNKIAPSGTLYVGSGFQSSSDEELANALGE